MRGAPVPAPTTTSAAAPDADPAPRRARDFHQRWSTLRAPLRPPPAVIETMADALAACAEPTLLLGVTPELAALPRVIHAVDWNQRMIDCAWPGDTADKRALLADWRALPFGFGTFGAVMGDGALTMLDWPGEATAMLRELARVLRHGGRAAIRCLATPDPAESLDVVAADTDAPFHLWRLRFNMAAAAADSTPAITSARLFDHYDRLAPAVRRADPCWNEVLAYRDSSYIHAYPGRAAILALANDIWPGDAHFLETSGYPGAAHCPILILDRA